MIKKLVIARKKQVTPEALGDLASFVEGESVPISPVAWGEESGLSHWGWVLSGLKLKDLEALSKWEQTVGFATVLSLGDEKKPITTDEALASVGLRVNTLA